MAKKTPEPQVRIEGRLLAVVLARGGSKRVPRKNLDPRLGGRPLIAWTLDAALAAKSIGRVVVSTDDPEIAETARQLAGGSPKVVVVDRPAELAADNAPSAPAVRHAFEAAGADFDAVVLLQPTSPWRTAEDIDGAARVFFAAFEPMTELSLVGVGPFLKAADRDLLRWALPGCSDRIHEFGKGTPPFPGAELYVLNGALYMLTVPALQRWAGAPSPHLPGERLVWIMPAERSADLDTDDDFEDAKRTPPPLPTPPPTHWLDSWQEGRS